MTKQDVIAITTDRVVRIVREQGGNNVKRAFESGVFCAWVANRISQTAFDLLWDNGIDDDLCQAEEERILNDVYEAVCAAS